MRRKSKLENRRDQASVAILSMLAASQKSMTLSSMLRELRFRQSLILDCLNRLVEKGTLARMGSGRRGQPYRYMLTHEFYLSTSKIHRSILEEKPDIAEEQNMVEILI